MELKRILLPTDFSECAARAYGPAASIARRFEAEIDLVHVSEFPPPAGVEIIGIGVADYNRRILERLREVAGSEVFRGIVVRSEVLDGHGVRPLAEYAERGGHDLAVIATHGHRGVEYLLLGSFTEKALRLLPCPVLTIRGDTQVEEFHPARILYPYDFSECSRAALDPLRFLARTYGAEVILLHVLRQDLIPVPGFSAQTGFPAADRNWWRDTEEFVRGELKTFAQEELGELDVRIEARTGSIPKAILAVAGEYRADVIVMGTHGYSGLKHALLGSVAEKVVRTATTPVLTVRPRSAED